MKNEHASGCVFQMLVISLQKCLAQSRPSPCYHHAYGCASWFESHYYVEANREVGVELLWGFHGEAWLVISV